MTDPHYPTSKQIEWLRDCNAAGYDPVLEVQVLREKVMLLEMARSPAPAATVKVDPFPITNPCGVCGVKDGHAIGCPEDDQKPPATVTRWRLVERDEILQEGDERWVSRVYGWKSVTFDVGHKQKDSAPIRRRLTPPALTDAMRALVDKWSGLAERGQQYDLPFTKKEANVYQQCADALRSAVAAVREGKGETE